MYQIIFQNDLVLTQLRYYFPLAGLHQMISFSWNSIGFSFPGIISSFYSVVTIRWFHPMASIPPALDKRDSILWFPLDGL